MTATTLLLDQPRARRSVPRSKVLAHTTAGVVLTASAIALAVTRETGVSSVVVFAVLPDLALFLGIGASHQPGQLPRRAVPAYNVLHHPALPVALLAAFATGLLGSYWLVAGLAWLAHISFDRACGYGLRTWDGWQRG